MSTARVIYKGNLRTECLHLQSGATFITDAPVDNQGKGEAFSPTDTVATGLANCMMTVMGIKAKSMDLSLEGAEAEVTKIMASDPRRIAEIKVHFTMPGGIADKERKILENTAQTCPVQYSLHPDIKREITFDWK